jgi:SagB-type dehydrogenase family enzyme
MAIRKAAFARTRAALLALALWAGGIGPAALASGEDAVALPAPSRDGTVPVERALAQRRSLRKFAPDPLPLASVSQLLWAAQGITHASGLRTAPSAGALYPLEVYLVVGAVSGLAPGVYRYDPGGHLLVPGAKGDLRAGVAAGALDQAWIADAPAILVIGAVYQRTVRKYGERATRYVHMEVGHAAQNVYLQATALGLGTTMVGAFRDEQIARLLELPERVDPLGLLPVGRRRSP